MTKASEKRTIDLIAKEIKKLDLDLSGLVVLTEVGSNNYLYTPIIAALANAKRVNAWVRDSTHGSAEDIKRDCIRIAELCGVADKISIVANAKCDQHIKEADIITNSGALRPINMDFIDKLKKSCVIPLMYEAWEVRGSDIDVSACRQKGIQVAGTWENHPLIKVFDSFGMLSIKLALEAGFEVVNNKIVIWSADHFGDVAERAFRLAGASKVILTQNREVALKEIADADFVYFCSYHESRELVAASDAVFTFSELKARNENLCILHMYGKLNYKRVREHSFHVYPKRDGREKVMTETLAYLGPQPVVSLQVAGFKVAQIMRSPDDKYSNLLQKLS